MCLQKATFVLIILAAMFFVVSPKLSLAKPLENKLPEDAAAALASATHVTLYSLDSQIDFQDYMLNKLFHGNKVLGKTELNDAAAKKATTAFQGAVSASDGEMTRCFEPHHALRLTASGHTYDYLLCYKCSRIEVYEDENSEPVASLGASGSPDILNGLLTAAHIQLSYIYSPEYIAAEKKRLEDQETDRARWIQTHAH